VTELPVRMIEQSRINNRSACAARCHCGECIREADAMCGETVQIRCSDSSITVTAEIVTPVIVGDEEQYIPPFTGTRRCLCSRSADTRDRCRTSRRYRFRESPACHRAALTIVLLVSGDTDIVRFTHDCLRCERIVRMIYPTQACYIVSHYTIYAPNAQSYS